MKKALRQLTDALLLGSFFTVLTFVPFIAGAYLRAPDWYMDISFRVLFWAQWVVTPFLEPHYRGRTGMLDGPYRMINWGLSLLVELAVYTAFFYWLIGWFRRRFLRRPEEAT